MPAMADDLPDRVCTGMSGTWKLPFRSHRHEGPKWVDQRHSNSTAPERSPERAVAGHGPDWTFPYLSLTPFFVSDPTLWHWFVKSLRAFDVPVSSKWPW